MVYKIWIGIIYMVTIEEVKIKFAAFKKDNNFGDISKSLRTEERGFFNKKEADKPLKKPSKKSLKRVGEKAITMEKDKIDKKFGF